MVVAPKAAYKGSPVNDTHQPRPDDLISLWNFALTAASAGGRVADSLAGLQALEPTQDGAGGLVYASSTLSENGVYKWDLANTQWDYIAPLPISFSHLENVAGTANAITADVAAYASPGELSWIVFTPLYTNTAGGGETITFGGTTYNLKNGAGEDLAPGDLIAGVVTSAYKVNGEWRQVVSSNTSAMMDYQGAWDSGATYTQSQFVTKGNILYFLNAASSTNEDPASGLPWVVVFNVNSILSMGAVTPEKLSYTLTGNNADNTGVTDISALLVTLSASFNHIVVSEGVYLIDANITLPETLTVEFLDGATFDFSATGYITWNGRLKAGWYQTIFTGDLIKSAYTRIGSIPFTFALQGAPQTFCASPFWFEGAGDGVTDDFEALYCALYFAGKLYLPANSNFLTSYDIQMRQEGQGIFGDGITSKITGAAVMTQGGALITVRGEPPTTASGTPAVSVKGCGVKDIHLDTQNVTNMNGFGVQWAQDWYCEGCFFTDIGRKPITLQYHVHNGLAHNNTIYGGATEDVGSNRSIFSLEGQTALLNHTNDGGVASTADLLGEDVTGNVFDNNTIYDSNFRIVVIQRAKRNIISNLQMPDAETSGGVDGDVIYLGDYAQENIITNWECGDTTRRFLNFEATANDNLIEKGRCGTANGDAVDGFSFECAGARNKVQYISFAHDNPDTTGNDAVSITGPDNEFEHIEVRSAHADVDTLVVASSGATNLKLRYWKITAPNITRILLSTAANTLVEGCEADATNASTGFQFEGDYFEALNNTIGGNASNRILGNGDNGVVIGNRLTGGASARINMGTGTPLNTSACHSNPGDTGGQNNLLVGGDAVYWNGSAWAAR